MLNEILYYMIFGKPLIMYGGIATVLLLLATASIPKLNQMGKTRIPIVWHFRLAYLTIAFGLIHELLGLFAFL